MGEIQAVFIDRDGTIGGTGHFIHPNDFDVYPFTEEALNLLKENGIKIFACTNQHCISLGEASLGDFQREFERLGFDDALICPHGANEGCECRKPKPGLLLDAAEKYHLDLTKTVFIGDVGATDMLAADAAGALKILVLTGWGEDSLHQYRHTWSETEPDFIAENLLDAVKWIIEKR